MKLDSRAVAGIVIGLLIIVPITTYNLTWSSARDQAFKDAQQELATKALAHVSPKLHARVKSAMTQSATELKTIASDIQKTTWPDQIQREMNNLAKLYSRAVAQLESYEINESAQRLLATSLADIQEVWQQIREKEDNLALSPALDNRLHQMRGEGFTSLMSSLQILSAVLMLEEGVDS